MNNIFSKNTVLKSFRVITVSWEANVLSFKVTKLHKASKLLRSQSLFSKNGAKNSMNFHFKIKFKVNKMVKKN